MTKAAPTRAERAVALQQWADTVKAEDLVEIDTTELRLIAEIAQRRNTADAELTAAVAAARRAGRSWSEIAAMLGVTKQAAQRKYTSKPTAA